MPALQSLEPFLTQPPAGHNFLSKGSIQFRKGGFYGKNRIEGFRFP
jgi:hypothetical protein